MFPVGDTLSEQPAGIVHEPPPLMEETVKDCPVQIRGHQNSRVPCSSCTDRNRAGCRRGGAGRACYFLNKGEGMGVSPTVADPIKMGARIPARSKSCRTARMREGISICRPCSVRGNGAVVRGIQTNDAHEVLHCSTRDKRSRSSRAISCSRSVFIKPRRPEGCESDDGCDVVSVPHAVLIRDDSVDRRHRHGDRASRSATEEGRASWKSRAYARSG